MKEEKIDKDRIRYLFEGNNFERREEFEKRIILEDFHRKVIGKSLLTEQTMNKIIEMGFKTYEDDPFRKHSASDKYRNYIPEGIDIDRTNRTISYNPTHEDYVSTSADTNPTQDHSFGSNVQVWSIFKRNKISNYNDIDGNPLVYALKKEKDKYGQLKWRFEPKKDEVKIMNQITLIIDKFNNSHQYGTTIVVPSNSELNNILANTIQKRKPDTKILNGVLIKLTTGQVYEEATDLGSYFRHIYNTADKFNKAEAELLEYIKRMKKKRGGIFTFHFIPDKTMRDAIGQSLTLSYGAVEIYASDVNDKDVLIIDDSLSQGNTIRNAIDIIKSTFTPKSINVLTLFSKL